MAHVNVPNLWLPTDHLGKRSLRARIPLSTCSSGKLHQHFGAALTDVYMCIYIYTCVCICVYIYTYVYIYTHTHMCVCMYIYKQTPDTNIILRNTRGDTPRAFASLLRHGPAGRLQLEWAPATYFCARLHS